MANSILSSQSPILPNITAALGIMPCILGINAIINPRKALSLLDFPPPSDPEAQKLTDNLMRIYGARNMAVGMPTLIAWYFGDRKVLGWLMISGVVVAGVDGWVSRLQIGKGEWNHWGVAPFSFALGASLLGWFGGD